MAESRTSSPLRRVAVAVRGVVQGVGFRPFVYNAARSQGLGGWVLNEADLVRIEAQGSVESVAAFLKIVQNHPPSQAKIDALEIRDIPCRDDAPTTFEIRTSDASSLPGPTIPADLAACEECLAEIFNSSERRFGYPFANCTNCGPRWSIIEQLPYDRPRTSMKSYAMCAECRAEYENPADRRFHAQPIACPACGPHLQLLDAQGRRDVLVPDDGQMILRASEAIKDGHTLALKGLGGFQLLADATSAAAVARLRERKRRPDRPFALMMRSLAEVRWYCEVSEEETRMLASHQAPIVLLRKNAIADQPLVGARSRLNDSSFIIHHSSFSSPLSPLPSPLTPNIAPGNPYLGIMLPCTPLHHLLMAAVDRPIVCTSGNLAEEPMAISLEDALRRLGHVADLFLTHDRSIVRPVDDSIVRFGPAGMQVLRRARGFAPLPVPVDNPSGRTILALGGHLKNTVALCLKAEGGTAEGGRRKAEEEQLIHPSSFILHPSSFPLPPSAFPLPTILSAHIGDLDSAASVEVFRKAIDDLTQFYQVRPDIVVCDLHPDYASTRQAETLAARWNVPLLRVQHHHAHVAACMAEHGLTGPVLGFAWDGTGYGADGTIWGGEALVVEASRGVPAPGLVKEFSHVAHLRTFALPGGDAAARKPRRSALGVLYEIFGEEAAKYAEDWFPPGEMQTLMQMLRRGTNCPRTSSLGRLFDAVAAILGLSPSRGSITFEGQAAMALEFAAEEATSPLPSNDHASRGARSVPGEGPGVRAYRMPLERHNSGVLVSDWEPMIRQILADVSTGEPAGRIAARFHLALAEMAVEIAQSAGLQQIVLSGGCFQNALLLRRTFSRLTEAGYRVFLPQQVPPGDGGIALGQILIAGLKSKSE
ncbi:MAG: carbamoyltransferase HypF [Pirellulales bacterium]|nr:carbamoyltransferase HypF [Pirellulales bacterium]